MPLQLSGVPFQLDQSTAGMPDIITALSKGMDLGQNARLYPQQLRAAQLTNQLAQIKNQYAQPMAQQDLLKAQLANQYYGQNIQSQIGLRNAQQQEAMQQAQWLGPQAQAEIGLQGANAQSLQTTNRMNQLKLAYLQQALGMGAPSAGPDNPTFNPGSMNSTQPYSQYQGSDSNDQDTQQNSDQQIPQQPYQQQAQQPSQNSMYGIETPQMTPEDIKNNMLFGSNSYQAKLENAKAQQQDQYKLYQKDMEDATAAANELNQMNQLYHVFNNAMDKSTYKGQILGYYPSSGIWSEGGNLAPEQIADQASALMTPSKMGLLTEAMKKGSFTNKDMEVAKKLAASRTMNDDTRKFQSDFFGGSAQRMNERAKFVNLMQNPYMNVKNQDMNALWANYQRDFPMIDDNGKFAERNMNKWAYYATPQAIQSIQRTGNYTPSKQTLKTEMMSFPPDLHHASWWVAPVPQNRIAHAIRRGAKTL